MVILVLGSWFFQRPEFEDEYFFHVSGSLLGNHCFFFIDFTGFIALRLTRNTIKNCSAKCTFLLVTFFHFQRSCFFLAEKLSLCLSLQFTTFYYFKFFIVLLSKGIPHTYRKQLP
jgi:hypothetical protein